MSTDYQEVLEFWFSEKAKPLWFRSTPEFDAELRNRYLTTWQAAAAGQLGDWCDTPEGALALVIVLDQFPLNIFRGKPESFSTEAQSRNVAAAAIDKGWDRQIEKSRLAFLYLPFMHSEDLADQDRSVVLFEEAGLQDNLRFARHHRELIRRFGRFPHRNVILGRTSSDEELAYLDSKEAFHG